MFQKLKEMGRTLTTQTNRIKKMKLMTVMMTMMMMMTTVMMKNQGGRYHPLPLPPWFPSCSQRCAAALPPEGASVPLSPAWHGSRSTPRLPSEIAVDIGKTTIRQD